MSEPALLATIDMVATLFWGLRVAAGIGAGLVGWFLTGPIVRLLYRGAFRRPAPGWLLPWARLGGAAVIGLLVFYYLPLGGGGGFGWGAGAGGGPGRGPGDGSSTTKKDQLAETEKANVVKTPIKGLENLEIELIGGKRYRDDGRYYLINRREPEVALEDVEDYLKKNKDRLAEYVTIVLTPTSVDAQHGAVLRLNTVIEKYDRIPKMLNIN